MTSSIRKRLYIQPTNLARIKIITVRNIPNRICKTASKFEIEILKIGRCNSRSFEYAECGYDFTLLFCKERQINEQRIITHACRTAIVLVVAEVQLLI